MTRTPSELDNGLYAPDRFIYARDETTEPTVDDSDRELLTGKTWNPGALFMPSENADDDTIRRRVREAGKRAIRIIEPKLTLMTMMMNALNGNRNARPMNA